ncbi:MAG TPA: GlsB/YeaQ/YmgE family stress response membrane protein [Ktedonobacterales bacterium]
MTHQVLLAVGEPGSAWGWIVWIVIGGLAGWLAGVVVRGAGFGVIGDILIGIVGAIIGGLILSAIGVGGNTLLWTFVAAFVGAVILLLIVRLIAGGRTRGRAL